MRRAALLAIGLSACGEPLDPPGRSVAASAEPTLALPVPVAEPSSSASPADLEPGHGDKIASIAMRNWIYQEPSDRSTKLGYLRAGAVVDRARVSAGTRGCAGGWYRVAPRGYVCVGKGASLELDHEVVQAAPRGPRRGEPLPYHYVMSLSPPPHLYFRLASEEEQNESEGDRRGRSIALFAARARERIGPADPLPAFLASGKPLPKPYGAERPLHYRAHRGRARESSAFGLVASFDWTGRRMGLTTELDLIPLDRTRVVAPSAFHGIELKQPGVPAFVVQYGVSLYQRGADGRMQEQGEAPFRSGWVLVPPSSPDADWRGLVETVDGFWLPAGSLRIAKLREDGAGFARAGRRWIDVSIRQQLLVAYQGTEPAYATLVSSGRGEMGDPDKTHATIRGTFMIHTKHVSGTMDGDETAEDAFDLRDVPYIQYFHEGFALHGAYWHDDFGKVRSHGCVNLAPADAAWLFEWTEPSVPEGWHGALNLQHGTLVQIHG